MYQGDFFDYFKPSTLLKLFAQVLCLGVFVIAVELHL